MFHSFIHRLLATVALLCAFYWAYGLILDLADKRGAFEDYPPEPLASLPPGAQATRIFVDKSQRRMWLFAGNVALRRYPIALGAQPVGHKQQEGDERTPTGNYLIDWRNDQSVAHLSLHISYPNAHDRAQAQARGVSPGGNIMIHGLLNGYGWVGARHLTTDWTDGCIAVTNTQMEEIWSLVKNGTPIEIVE